MLPLLLSILSYGALLLLLMPPSAVGVLVCAALFALGSAWMICKKPRAVPFWKGRRYLAFSIVFAATAVFLTINRAVSFHEQWRYSSRLKTVAGLLHTSLDTLLLVGAILLAAGALYFLYVALCLMVQWLSRPGRKPLGIWGDLLACVVAAAVTVITAQIMIEAGWLSMGTVKLLWAVLIVTALILLLYCLFEKVMPAICVVSGLFMLISTINVYVYRFRERIFEPVDIFSAGTAMNVAENYSLLPIPLSLLVGWVIFLAWLYVIWQFRHGSRIKPGGKARLILLALCAVSLVASFFYTSNLKTYHWHKQGAQYNGYVLDFVSKFKELSPSEPENYSAEQIAQLAEQYSASDGATGDETAQTPHIIVIMDESFADLSVVGDFSTNTEVTPFISSLTENTISGYALSSVFGGNTANSEYEFLTGNSMAWLSPNTVPYQQYLHASTYSMVSYLKSSWQYKCIAMHPYESSGWNRPAVYDYLGFDQCYFLEDFPQENYVRDYVSDREMFEFLIETYEAQKDEPLFFFGVTMQNHGAYYYSGDNYTQYISLEEYGDDFPDAEQYLSLIYETDRAVEYLISYFQDVDEDVLIVFFGDHQPKVDEAFFETIGGGTADTLAEQQKRYQVPFFIWANYDIDEAYVDCTSLNYLSSYVYQAAGLTLPPYNRFLQELETVIPVINANGFYSLSSGGYLSFDEAEGEEQQWLALYEALQYNSCFDKTNRSQIFFPTVE